MCDIATPVNVFQHPYKPGPSTERQKGDISNSLKLK